MDIEGVKRVITRLIIGCISPDVLLAGTHGNMGCVGIEKREMEDDSGVTTVDIDCVEGIIARLIIG